jgi:hypothetical protein
MVIFRDGNYVQTCLRPALLHAKWLGFPQTVKEWVLN